MPAGAQSRRQSAPLRHRLGFSGRLGDATRRARNPLRRCGFNATDVYLNVAGGLRITEPAADLAVAAALVSAAYGPRPRIAGIGVSSARSACPARSVRSPRPRRGSRRRRKLGFDAACLPRRVARGNRPLAAPDGHRALREIGHLSDLVARFAKTAASSARERQGWQVAPGCGYTARGMTRQRPSSETRAIYPRQRPASETRRPKPSPETYDSIGWPHLNWVDVLAVTIVIFSGLLALMRGFVREVLSIAAWIGALASSLSGPSPSLRAAVIPKLDPESGCWQTPSAFLVDVRGRAWSFSRSWPGMIGGVVRGSVPSAASTARLAWRSGIVARRPDRWLSSRISRLSLAIVTSDRWPEPVLQPRTVPYAHEGAVWAVGYLLPAGVPPHRLAVAGRPSSRPRNPKNLLHATAARHRHRQAPPHLPVGAWP